MTCFSPQMDNKSLLIVFSVLFVFGSAAPVLESKPEVAEAKIEKEMDDLGLEYGRYLQQVVEALEQDKDFAKKLENVSQEEIKNGAIARELNFVGHHVRNRLDELKRIEIERLRSLAKRERQLEDNQDNQDGGQGGERRWRTLVAEDNNDLGSIGHLDHKNIHSFEAEDLQKLILSATKDLEELDQKRREDFKNYEMEKELRYRDQLANMTIEERKKAEEEHDQIMAKHREHPKVHHPGSKKQLEQVWEEQDKMPVQEFNPKVFFTLHDVNGDGFLDPQEVEAILSLEIRKLYGEGGEESRGGRGQRRDENEMMEEFHRMREHIYKEADLNRDGLISKKEFLDFTRRMEFERDDGWKGLEEQKVYSPEELKRYEGERQRLQQQQQQYGAYQQYQYLPEGYPQGHQQGHPQGQQYGGQYPPQGHPQQYQQHPDLQLIHNQQQQQQFGQHVPPVGQHPVGGQPQHQYPPQGHPDQLIHHQPQQQQPQHQQQFQAVGGQPQYPPQGHPQGQPQYQMAGQPPHPSQPSHPSQAIPH